MISWAIFDWLTNWHIDCQRFKCVWQTFLFARLNLPNVMISIEKKISIAILLLRVLMHQKRQISLPVG